MQLYLKRDSGTGVFRWIFRNFKGHIFYRVFSVIFVLKQCFQNHFFYKRQNHFSQARRLVLRDVFILRDVFRTQSNIYNVINIYSVFLTKSSILNLWMGSEHSSDLMILSLRETKHGVVVITTVQLTQSLNSGSVLV